MCICNINVSSSRTPMHTQAHAHTYTHIHRHTHMHVAYMCIFKFLTSWEHTCTYLAFTHGTDMTTAT